MGVSGPANFSWSDEDRRWMAQALALAEHGAAQGEVPVGAVLVGEGGELGAGWNSPVTNHDPTAHAEILALRSAAARVGNYRLPGTTLYATMEPCPMCAGAIVHARVARVVYAAPDANWGAAGSQFDLLGGGRLNHHPRCEGGLEAEQAAAMLKAFFGARR